MNPNTKGVAIGGVTGVAVYIGDIVHYMIERGVGDLPEKIDVSVVGLVVAASGYLIYRYLPSGTPTPTQ